MKIKLNYKEKEIVINNVEKCQGFWQQARGLMFKSRPKPLFFVFDKPTRMGIHSFFVKQAFLAIWVKKNKVTDVKIVEPWTLSIKPKQDFDSLLEIPFKSEQEISMFLDGSEKDLKTIKH